MGSAELPAALVADLPRGSGRRPTAAEPGDGIVLGRPARALGCGHAAVPPPAGRCRTRLRALLTSASPPWDSALIVARRRPCADISLIPPPGLVVAAAARIWLHMCWQKVQEVCQLRWCARCTNCFVSLGYAEQVVPGLGCAGSDVGDDLLRQL